ncbi:phosphoinositide 3-kinase regulatory subunit 5 isoform X2 [Callorhinchus milii]|uniref:phosphoinositide 3-kinase regulatory subunit 5 isoform X2 n=1 Tax=Callorhinchus milii TaxID=7868 RepID=UPI0004571F3E|nr:phosphoinositide 3-kinase regulatory subunit 5 isoform X2 [Callorhinchus milii]|eukprot:gi/632942861/ref/XP_007886655.1/ PREDICTED: phosphoinositide 3-kinase regulatory subunit 5 isoform X2 [Callorhinchus milii]
MQHTSCTEDRIHHTLERCLHGLDKAASSSANWNAGLCMNRWTLEELVSREPDSFLILLEKVLLRTQEVQEMCQYDLMAPLALTFYSAALQTPHFPPDSQLLQKAFDIYQGLLAWPIPYCNICQHLLTFIRDEMRAPGISFQRLVRAEQGLTTPNLQSKTMTVLLLNSSEVPSEFMLEAERIASRKQSRRHCCISLVKHAYQAAFGTKYNLSDIQNALESKSTEEVLEISSKCSEVLESAGAMKEVVKSREYVVSRLEEIRESLGFTLSSDQGRLAKLQTIPLPPANCHSYHWDQDNFDILHDILQKECDIPSAAMLPLNDDEDEEEEDEDEDEGEDTFGHVRDSVISTISVSSKEMMKSFVSNMSGCVDSGYAEEGEEGVCETRDEEHQTATKRLTKRIFKFFRAKSSLANNMLPPDQAACSWPLRRAGSLDYATTKCKLRLKSRRSQSLPQQVTGALRVDTHLPHSTGYKRRPYLSFEDETKIMTLRVVVFGTDRMLGKVARAYSNLRIQESKSPFLTKYFKMQFFHIPLKENIPRVPVSLSSAPDNQRRSSIQQDCEDAGKNSNDRIAQYLGMLDPWYQRNVLDLLNLPTDLLCQEPSKPENGHGGGTQDKLSILGDLTLYYCRNAAQPVLIQLFQAELTLAGGEKKSEVFIYSLEMGQSAATRAIKASGAGKKRLGIDGDREAVPLALQISYSRATVSRRNQWNDVEKSCTSVNLRKACKRHDGLASPEYLHLSMTEVVKRQNSKTKMSYNQQISVTRIKVDKVQVLGRNSTTFVVCFDQDEQKVLQSVTRCEVSVCYKPEKMVLQRLRKESHFQQHPSKYYSLLCLPIVTFSGPIP